MPETSPLNGIRCSDLYNTIGVGVNSPADGKKEFDEAIMIKLDYGWRAYHKAC
jgi:hypothetical protein